MEFEKRAKVLFNSILKEYKVCDVYILKLINKKNNLKNLNRQTQDDSKFYESILSDTIYYFTKSIEVRRIKFASDLTVLNRFFNEKAIEYKLVQQNILVDLLEKYKKAKNAESKSELIWIKDDDITFVGKWKTDLINTFNYHYCLIESFCKTLQNEFFFYNDNRPMDKLVEVLLNKKLKKEEEIKNNLEKTKIQDEILADIIQDEEKENTVDEQIKKDVEEEIKQIEKENKTI